MTKAFPIIHNLLVNAFFEILIFPPHTPSVVTQHTLKLEFSQVKCKIKIKMQIFFQPNKSVSNRY